MQRSNNRPTRPTLEFPSVVPKWYGRVPVPTSRYTHGTTALTVPVFQFGPRESLPTPPPESPLLTLSTRQTRHDLEPRRMVVGVGWAWRWAIHSTCPTADRRIITGQKKVPSRCAWRPIGWGPTAACSMMQAARRVGAWLEMRGYTIQYGVSTLIWVSDLISSC